MTTTFDEREKGFEAKFKLDQELQFKVNVRRDKLLGLWAAELMGIAGDAAKAYALSVVDAEFSEPDHDASRKVARDLAESGVSVEERQLKKEVERFQAMAQEQLGVTVAADKGEGASVQAEADPSRTVSETIGQFIGKKGN